MVTAAMRLILRQGYTATTVDQICQAAGVSKGAFFHHFANKEEIGHAAMDAWMNAWRSILANSRLENVADPLDRLERLFETMAAAYGETGIEIGCVVGTVAQEQALPHDGFREHSLETFTSWVEQVAALLQAAKDAYPPQPDFDAAELAWWLHSFVQGSFLIAKVRRDRKIILDNLAHCRAYVMGHFHAD